MVQKLQNTAKDREIPIQVFNPFAASKKYSYNYIVPSTGLEDSIDSHWTMHWDLAGESPFKLELASSPFIALTFTQYGNFITGIHTGVYSYTIANKGTLYGTLFKPSRFYELYRHPLRELTNKEVPLASIFPQFDDAFSGRLRSAADDKTAIKTIEDVISALKKSPDTLSTPLVDQITDYSINNPEKSIKQIAVHHKMSERTLHKLFHDSVGVGIKWITARDRLQKAMYIAAKSENKPNWTAVAYKLGYSDQSHFINDFKRIIGMSPSRYYNLLARTK